MLAHNLSRPGWHTEPPAEGMDVLATWNFKSHRVVFFEQVWMDSNTLEVLDPPTHWAYLPPAILEIP